MKAVLLKQIAGATTLVDTNDYPKPTIQKPSQLLIKIKSAAVNPIDLQIYEGKNESRLLNSDILGRELSGVVVAVGSTVKKFKPADQVFLVVGSMGSNGAFAEYVVVDEEIVAHKPADITFEAAASLPVAYATAWQTAERLNLSKESSILILGASGSVGKALMNVLRHFGYNNLTGTAGTKQSREQLLKFGLANNRIVSYQEPGLYEAVTRINNDRLYDIVMDCVGNEITEIGAQALKREGTFVDITNLRTSEASYTLFQKAAIILNISRYAEADLHYKYGLSLAQIARCIVDEKWVLQEVNSVRGLHADNILGLFALLKINKTNGNKLVLTL